MAMELKQAIEKVLALQHQWTARKTEAMDARGDLIRNTIPSLLRPFADDRGHEVFGSSGAGSNNRVPWVRIFRQDVSPSPQIGWYVVLLFAADASALYVALIQGTTEWTRGRGTQLDSESLLDRSNRARSVIRDSGIDLHDLDESIRLHDPGLGKGYELGTAFALRYSADAVPDDDTLLVGISRIVDLAAAVYNADLGEGGRRSTAELDEAAPAGTRAWIFQANPSVFDVAAAVQQLDSMTWTVRRYKDQIHAGDQVYVWRSGTGGGIVATGVVLTEPALMMQDDDEKQFVLKPEELNQEETRVRISIKRIVEPVLSRTTLNADARLAELSILKYGQATNFPVTEQQAEVLDELIEEHLGAGESTRVVENPIRNSSGRIWAYAPGPNAVYWEEFYREGIIGIGGDELGDFRRYADQDALTNAIVKTYNRTGRPVNDALGYFQFANTIQPRDTVIAKKGLDVIVGYGVVTGDYEYRPERSYYKHIRQVRWDDRGQWQCTGFPVKALTDISKSSFILDKIERALGLRAQPPAPAIPPALPAYTTANALDGIAFDVGSFERMRRVWESKKNLILQGPPGVGKTFLARRLAYALIGHELPSRVGMVQFHQSYSYEDFIQGYRPSRSGFERRDGVFVRFCNRAKADQNSKYVFIIDEINRGNISKVFGELLMLIEREYRGSRYSISLTYSTQDDEQFYVPENVYILGMMNTADRSLALVDYALRRRFAFERLNPLFSDDSFLTFLEGGGMDGDLANEVCRRMADLNADIAKDTNLGQGFCVGHSYFCRRDIALTKAGYFDIVQNEIVPLLEEYWLDDEDQVTKWREKLLAEI